MKHLLLLSAFLPLFALADATDDEPKKNPETEAAEKAARVAEMVKAYRNSSVTVQFRLKTLPDGSKPNIVVDYRCPVGTCSSHTHFDDSLDKNYPCVMVGYVLAPNRVLVQDIAVRPEWVEKLEVVSGNEAIPAKIILRYPAENALLLETAHPMPAAKPLVFSGDATNKPALFHVVEDVDGRVRAGLRPLSRAFIHEVASGENICASLPNTLVVDASNRVVSVQMRKERPLADVVPKPPSEWASEPVERLESRVKELEARLARSVLPIYLHIDEEKKVSRSRFSFIHDDSDDNASGDVDTVGLALSGGDVLVPMNLSSSKVAALDKMEAILPDGSKAPLTFLGAFSEYGFFLLRFAEGMPKGVEAVVFSSARPDALARTRAYRLNPQNRNGVVKINLAPRRVDSFRRVQGGLVVPNCAQDSMGDLLLSESCEILTMGGCVRASGERWNSRLAVPGTELKRVVEARDFDPEFAVRKGKDRIRVAWIGVETQAMTKELARQTKALGFLAAGDGRGSLVGKVYPGTPAAKAGLKEGDVLLWVRKASGTRHERLETRDSNMGFDFSDMFSGMRFISIERMGITPWPQVESGVNETFTKLGIGTKVVLAWVSGGEKHEAELVLEQAPVHYRTAKRIRNRALGIVAADLTFEVRNYLKLKDDAPGVVITKMQDGSPAAIAGLRPFEVITEVNGEPVSSAVRFAELIKEKRSLSFMVRRLDETRIVRIQLKEEKDGEKK